MPWQARRKAADAPAAAEGDEGGASRKANSRPRREAWRRHFTGIERGGFCLMLHGAFRWARRHRAVPRASAPNIKTGEYSNGNHCAAAISAGHGQLWTQHRTQGRASNGDRSRRKAAGEPGKRILSLLAKLATAFIGDRARRVCLMLSSLAGRGAVPTSHRISTGGRIEEVLPAAVVCGAPVGCPLYRGLPQLAHCRKRRPLKANRCGTLRQSCGSS
jgi:hypothetical protein